MKNNRLAKILMLLLLAVISSSCCRHDGPYKGRVIDSETKQPLEGVVVLGVWYKELPGPGGSTGTYFDAQETVTDKKGDFELKGQGLQILSTVSMMHVLIFKAGYKYVGSGMWVSLKVDGGLMEKKADWEGDRAIIPLRKLTRDERRRNTPPSPPNEVHKEKIKSILSEINKDRIELGFDPINVGR
ncbi:MAG: hypothetical protein EPN25_02925 [Nitrospirae bacterium]|nr:MAG: hypothetical protein EPN25_02925 [Nitrospirota bacterium]